MQSFIAHSFGLRWSADTPLPLFPLAPDDGHQVDVFVRRIAALPQRDGGVAINSGWIFHDGIRFALDGVAFDMTGGDRIAWAAPTTIIAAGCGPPPAFYSTVTAMLLAWRGAVPLHGSAIEFDGRAILVAGRSGAGKSTLAAALIDCGGRLISDDLSMLAPTAAGAIPLLWPGRSAIRLVDPAAPNPADKQLAYPPMSDILRPVPLTTLLILRSSPIAPGLSEHIAALRRQSFRPIWMDAMPRRAERLATVLNAASSLSIVTLPPTSDAPHIDASARAEQALALMRGL